MSRGGWRAHSAAARRPVQVLDDAVVDPDGVRWTVLDCECIDLDGLETGRRGSLVSAFATLTRSCPSALQLVVQRRRWTEQGSADDPASDVPGRLRAATAHHRAQRLAEGAAFRTRLLVAVEAAGDTDPAVHSVERTLAVAGLTVRRIQDRELGDCVRESLGGTGASVRWDDGAAAARIGSVLHRAHRLVRLPGVEVRAGWLAPLLGVRCEADIAIHLVPVTATDALARLDRRLRDLRADQLIDLERSAMVGIRTEVGLDALLELRHRLAHNLARPVELSVTAVARGSDATSLAAASQRVADAFAATLSKAETAHLEHLDAALEVVPGGSSRHPRAKLVDSAAAATLVPWLSGGVDDPEGYSLGITADGTPVRVDPFDVRRQRNANIAVLAASGHGKTYAVGALVLEARAHGIDSVVIDPESEYTELARRAGGQVLTLDGGGGHALNVFDLIRIPEDPAATAAETVEAVVGLVDVLCHSTLDQVERAAVELAARSVLGEGGRGRAAPVLGDCIPALQRTAPRCATIVERFCNGLASGFLNRPSTLQVDQPLTVIALRDLPRELVPAACYLLAEWLWSTVRRDRRRRHLVFDEVGLLCEHPALRRLLVQLARRCRKYSASLVVATQNAQDLLATDEGTVIATNCATVLLGGHRANEAARMAAGYGLSAAHQRDIERLRRGEFLLVAGDRRQLMHVDVSDLHHAILTAHAAA